jgi:wyosine [tRNA(Phe)-imidazoG37] synthetase (radical SAM superfamily)
VRRQAFVTVQQFQADLASLGAVSADCITFAGLGEPTLAANLPELVAAVRERQSLPVAVLTGSALVPRQDVRRDLLAFDTVIASLDAPDEALFRRINRPGPGYPYSLSAIVDGIRRFRETYSGRLIVQMMFLKTNLDAASRMAQVARSLGTDEVQLNTPLQPALGGPISQAEMALVKHAFSGLHVRSVYDAEVRPRLI